MSNSKISISLEVKAGNASKTVNDLGQSFQKTSSQARSLANHIGEVASYQDVHVSMSKEEVDAIRKAQQSQEKLRSSLKQSSFSYTNLSNQSKVFKFIQHELNSTAKNSISVNKLQVKSIDDLTKAEENLTNNLKKVKEEAKETKKALSYLQAARTGNYTDAVKLQRKIDESIAKSHELQQQKSLSYLQAARSGNYTEAVKLQRKMDESVAKSRELQQQIQRSNTLITGIIGTAIASFSFRGIYEMSQDYIRLNNSLTLVASNGEDVKKTLADLYGVANEAKQPVEATAEAFLTLKKNTQKLNLSQKDLLALSSTVSKAIAIGGSTADQAKNSMIQFGQALSLGKLSGQNFNSVAEQTPGLIQAISTGLHMSAADLKNFANSGQLTTQLIVQSLQNANEETAQTFSKLGNTINGSLNILKNRFSQLVGENDFFSGKAAEAILLVANNLKLITAGVGLATLAVVGFKTQQFVNYLQDIGSSAETSSIRLGSVTNAVSRLGKEFSIASIKAKAYNVATVTSTVVMGGLTTAWKIFNTVVKASVIGAILAAAVWAVEKLVDGVTYLYEKWKEWREETEKTNKIVYKTDQEHLDALDIEISKNETILKSLKDKLKLKQDEIKLNSRGQIIEDGTQLIIASINRDIENTTNNLKQLRQERKKVENEIKAQKKAPLPTNSNDVNKDLNPTNTKVDSNLEAYNNNIKALKTQVFSAKQALKNLLEVGKSNLSNVDQLNIKLMTSADGYKNLTLAQKQQLMYLNNQLDQLKENTAYTEQIDKIQKQNDLLTYQLSLGKLSEEERAKAIDSYKLEQQIIIATLGLSKEHAQEVADQMRLTHRLTQQLKEEQQDTKNSFLTMLDAQRPSWQSFKSMIVGDVNKLSDAFANWALGGKVNFKEMTKSMLKDFLALTIKATALTSILEVGNVITGGGLSVALKTFNKFSKIFGFASGGYTGDIPTNKVAGVVHGGEFVLNNKATSFYGRDLLESMNKGQLPPSYFHTRNINNNVINKNNSPNIVINNNAGVGVDYHIDDNGDVYLTLIHKMHEIANYHATQAYENLSKG